MSLLAYGAVAEDYGGDLTYLDALCGLGYCAWQTSLMDLKISY